MQKSKLYYAIKMDGGYYTDTSLGGVSQAIDGAFLFIDNPENCFVFQHRIYKSMNPKIVQICKTITLLEVSS